MGFDEPEHQETLNAIVINDVINLLNYLETKGLFFVFKNVRLKNENSFIPPSHSSNT